MIQPHSVQENFSPFELTAGGTPVRLLLLGASTGLAYYVGSIIGFLLTLPHDATSTLWPPNAILLVALLLTPIRLWWIVPLGALPAHMVVQFQSGVPTFMVIGWFLTNCTEAFIGAVFIRRFISGPIVFASFKFIIVYLVGAVITAPLVSTFFDATLVALQGWKGDTYWEVWLRRFPSNVLAALTVAPFLLLLLEKGPQLLRAAPLRRYGEGGLLIGGFLLTVWLTFGWEISGLVATPALVYLPLPFLIWAALRFGPVGASTLVLLLVLGSIYGASRGHGPFAIGSSAVNVLSLQTFLIVVAFCSMFLSALIEERREKTTMLAESENRFRLMADTAPVLIWVSGMDKLCSFCNAGWLRFTGRALVQETGTGWMDGIHAADRDGWIKAYYEAFDRLKPFEREYRLRRYDGEYRWIVNRAVPRFGPNNTLLGYIGIALDITERKSSESRLSTQYRITRILSEASSLTDAGPKVIQAICECLDWQFGEIWQVDGGTQTLRLLTNWHGPSSELNHFYLASKDLCFGPGLGLPGRIWESRQPVWIADIANDKNFLRASSARLAGLRTAFGFLIIRGDESVGVVVFFARQMREPDQDLLHMMANIGEQMGVFVERKRTEEALRENDARLQMAMEASRIGYWDFDLATGRGARSESLERIFGFAPQASKADQTDFLAIVHPDDRERISLRSEEARRTGKIYDTEYRIMRPDGSIRWIVSRGRAITDSHGQVLRLLGLSTDITERKQTEDALRESERLRRGIYEAGPECVMLVAPDLSLLDMNPAGLMMIGAHSLEDVLGHSVMNLIAPEGHSGYLDLHERVCRGESGVMQFEMIGLKGNRHWMESHAVPLHDKNDRIIAHLAVTRDITERKRAEKELNEALAEVERLRDRLEAENVYLRSEVMGVHRGGEIIGISGGIEKVLDQVKQVAETDMTVLVLGETGTGKELVSRMVHENSGRRERPLVKVNCSALPAELIESELFGHERGAFTGAVSKQIGRFELADHGTIFLDEIGELPFRLQVKLLRVLQEGEFERLGSGKTIKVDVRVIAATNRNLVEAVERGRFRSDLYYRLNVYPIRVPPLRDRPGDIELLAQAFVQEAGRRLGKDFGEIPREIMQVLREYSWPGNVRELENVISRAAVTSRGKVLQLPEGWNEDLHRARSNPGARLIPSDSDSPRDHNGGSLTLQEFERNRIIEVLDQTNWRIEGQKGAALILGLHPNTLRSRMQRLGIKRPTKVSGV